MYTRFIYIYMEILFPEDFKIHCTVLRGGSPMPVAASCRRNNGETFTRNPGVQMLEKVCGALRPTVNNLFVGRRTSIRIYFRP